MKNAGKPFADNLVLAESLEALKRLPFFQAVRLIQPSSKGLDAQLELVGEWGSVSYILELQPKVSESTLSALTHRRQPAEERRLLVTSYVSPALAEQLRERRIEFLDASGNAYLDRPVYVLIFGKKPTRKMIRPNRALRPAGLRLLYVLLKDRAFLSRSQRELAMAAGIALGSVPIILKDLRDHGYLRLSGSNHTFGSPRELLTRWEQGYGDLLRPKLFRQTCRLGGADASLDILLQRLRKHPRILVGGELGAALLTRHLRPETATLHITNDDKLVMSSLRLIPDPQGNVTLLSAFGTQNAADETEIRRADPLLIHAELVQMAGDRIREISNMILETNILPRIA